MDIPIELFLGFIVLSFGMGVIGLWQKIPLLMLISGAMITFWALETDVVIMGKIPITSSVSGSTTTYAFIDNTFVFTQYPKILLGLIGSIVMFSGGLEWQKLKKDERS